MSKRSASTGYDEYDDYFMRQEEEEKRLTEQRKKRRERLAQVATEEPRHQEHTKPQDQRQANAEENTQQSFKPVLFSAPFQLVQSTAVEDDDMFNLDSRPFLDSQSPPKQDEPSGTVDSPKVYHASDAQTGLHDNWDDPDGYYRVMLGEKLDNRYQIFSILGRGIFATVVRARDTLQHGREVAIKIARRQETMYKAGMKEISILRLLSQADPDNKVFIVHFDSYFEHRGHLCMVFESLGLNLRDVVKRFGKDIGLNLHAVKTYTKQMLLALALLRAENIVHADIKPDNILVNEAKTIAKLADFGSASSTSEMDITPYLVSRFYRAPEISTYIIFNDSSWPVVWL